MDSILLISDKASVASSIGKLLSSQRDCTITTVATELEARKVIHEEDFDVILLNVPLEFSMGDDLVRFIMRNTYASLIYLYPGEAGKKKLQEIEQRGAFTLIKPISKTSFLTTFDHAVRAAYRTKGLYEENDRLRRKIQEMKIIDRAKVLLVEYLKLSEEQAHKYIEQQAMELRKSRAEIAQSIINTYEY